MTAATQPVEWLTTATVAAELGCNPETVRRWIARGDLPAFASGAVLRVRRSDLQAYIDRHMTAGRRTRRRLSSA